MDLALMYLSDMSRIRYLWPHFILFASSMPSQLLVLYYVLALS